jgi:hypothetical protein
MYLGRIIRNHHFQDPPTAIEKISQAWEEKIKRVLVQSRGEDSERMGLQPQVLWRPQREQNPREAMAD